MRRLPTILFSSLLVCFLAGCRSSSPCALVEAELRSKDDDLRLARAELDRTASYNEYLHRELRNLRQTVGGDPPPTGTSSALRIQKIVLGRQTGGYEKDGFPGDELLQVVIEPRDGDGHATKAAGNAEVEALQITGQGIKEPLCNWSISARELRRNWRSGFLSTGYFLQLPWKNWPATTEVRVIVRFVGLDGRIYEADKDVRVRVLPQVLRQAPRNWTPPVRILDPIPVGPPIIGPALERCPIPNLPIPQIDPSPGNEAPPTTPRELPTPMPYLGKNGDSR